MNQEDFFIGWQEKMPRSSRKAVVRLLVLTFVLIPVLVFLVVHFTKPFNDHVFELGEVRTFTGTYFSEPVPVLVLEEGQSPLPNQRHALVVGYGKNGASTFMEPLETEKGPLSGKRMKLRGTLIYGDGKVLIELTERENSIVELYEEGALRESEKGIGQQRLEGEIVDPKCWFGVMKPGEGKVHKSCAIRCISGGIPPVVRVDRDGKNEYYVLLNSSRSLNRDILTYVAEPVSIEGEVEVVNGWNVIWTDTEQIDYIEP